MVLTQEENELLTRIGPGTPMGGLLRRYWHPVACVGELTDDQPTRFVRIMGEDLVLFRDKSGRVGLIGDHCPHRGASMVYGRLEERGIACAYHGWLYDVEGNCLETPAEPADSKFYLTVKHKAYPVRKFCGMYWAYLGPPPAPEIPKFDVFVRDDYKRHIVIEHPLDCNWLQALENAVDAYHSAILHQDAMGRPPLPNTTHGSVDEIDHIECFLTSYGIMKRHVYKAGWRRQHPMVFPTTLFLERDLQINVPVDDTHTARFRMYLKENRDGDPDDAEAIPFSRREPYKTPGNAVHPFTRFEMHGEVLAQDYMAWETQGTIADRTTERLATSDRWIAWLREIYKENILKVQRGEDPFGVVRDPGHPMIPTDMWSDRREGDGGRESDRRIRSGSPFATAS